MRHFGILALVAVEGKTVVSSLALAVQTAFGSYPSIARTGEKDAVDNIRIAEVGEMYLLALSVLQVQYADSLTCPHPQTAFAILVKDAYVIGNQQMGL